VRRYVVILVQVAHQTRFVFVFLLFAEPAPKVGFGVSFLQARFGSQLECLQVRDLMLGLEMLLKALASEKFLMPVALCAQPILFSHVSRIVMPYPIVLAAKRAFAAFFSAVIGFLVTKLVLSFYRRLARDRTACCILLTSSRSS
jgi:hypothetical protein